MGTEEEVSTSMTWAYGQTLKPYHGWAVRPIFQVGSFAFSHIVLDSCLAAPIDRDRFRLIVACDEGCPLSIQFLPRPRRASRRSHVGIGFMAGRSRKDLAADGSGVQEGEIRQHRWETLGCGFSVPPIPSESLAGPV